MARLFSGLSGRFKGGTILTVLFFVLYYLYLWQVVDLRLIYHSGGLIFNFPVFYTGWEYFNKIVCLPGGLIDYTSDFLAQFFYIGWLGALIATIQVWLILLCLKSITRADRRWAFELISFATPILILILYLMYAYPFNVAMDLLAALFFALLYIKAAPKSSPASIFLFVILSAIVYAIAGGIFILFAVICVLDELLLKRRNATGIILLLCGPAIAYIESTFVFRMNCINVFRDFIEVGYKGEINYTTKTIIVYALYLAIPLTVIGLWVISFFKKPANIPLKAIKKKGNIISRLITWPSGKPAVISALFAIIATPPVVYFCHDSRIKGLIAVDYYASNKMWQQVFNVAVEQPYSIYINHAVNRALYHTNRLTTDMFAFGQNPDGLMLSRESATPLGWWRLADTYIDLGHMNLAEISLNEIEDLYGERPSFIKRFALIAMVKGDIESARIYLEALNRTLFDGEYAKEYLKKIEIDPNLSNDEEINRLRSLKPAIDRDIASINENIFLDLLAKNSHNRMAFEYLEAFYLSTNQLDKFIEYLELLNNYDYKGIPRLYEEAILIYNSKAKKQLAVSGGEISVDSRRRFDKFMMENAGGLWNAKSKLWQDFGDSYFFYYNYRQSGKR